MVAAVVPDYDLAPTVDARTPQQLKAIAAPVRRAILDLVLERAATVTELAIALDRPKSSVAYHVDVLVDAGLVAVVRTRRVRAIEERFYGRTGRSILICEADLPRGATKQDFLAQARAESAAVGGEAMWSTMHHARIPRARAEEFFELVAELSEHFTGLPREGDEVFGFVGAVYLTDHPTLPDAAERAEVPDDD